jgi:hypothetical protein
MKLLPFLLLLVLILSAWLLPSATPALGIALIVISLSLAFFAILRRHRAAYRQGKITRGVLVRNIFLDMFGILLAVALAGLLARYVVGIVTGPIGSATARVVAGIVLGLLVGIVIGTLVNTLWGRFAKTSPRS